MEIDKTWVSSFELEKLMIYLIGAVLLVQCLFWWLFKAPIISLDWIIELKFLKILLAAFLIWFVSGESKSNE